MVENSSYPQHDYSIGMGSKPSLTQQMAEHQIHQCLSPLSLADKQDPSTP